MKNSLINQITLCKMSLFSILCLLSTTLIAQVPRDIPSDTGPLTIDSTFDIILYIVLPVIVLIFFILYLVNKKKRAGDNENRK